MLRDREGGGALVLIPLLTRSKLITCFFFILLFYPVFILSHSSLLNLELTETERKKEYQFQLIIGKIIGYCILSLNIFPHRGLCNKGYLSKLTKMIKNRTVPS